ncbi:MAG: ubiquinol-cytochrome C chaperone family protein [Rhodospirillales bacterium]|nr:MAG: ubiquinol-cytochrome C chaperone family protein [Rhodospirillales bacterium]
MAVLDGPAHCRREGAKSNVGGRIDAGSANKEAGMLGLFRRRETPEQQQARAIYVALAEQARRPEFYADLKVPDTVDGRFDLLAVHAWLVIERLSVEPDAATLNQAVFDAMFGHLDLTVREMGAQDLGVGRRIKIMAEGFRGRSVAFQGAVADADDTALRAVVRRNVYGKAEAPDEGVDALCAYIRGSAAGLAAVDRDGMLAARLKWAKISIYKQGDKP